MIVVDASVVAAVVAQDDEPGRGLRDRLVGERLFAPELVDIEVTSAIRRARRTERLSADRAVYALAELALLPIARVSHTLLLNRIWALRDNLTAYDAAYVALAQVLDAPLLTRDGPMARAPGLECDVVLIS
jgi:predicted nucleic acid-binding protein